MIFLHGEQHDEALSNHCPERGEKGRGREGMRKGGGGGKSIEF